MAEQVDGRCVSVSELEDSLTDLEDRVEARYMALKEFAISHLKEESSRVNGFEERLKALEAKVDDGRVQELDDSLTSLRNEFEELKGASSSSFLATTASPFLATTSSPFIATTSSPFAGIDRFRALNTQELLVTENDVVVRPSSAASSPIKKKLKLGENSVEPVCPPKCIEDVKDEELRGILQKYYTSKFSPAERLSPAQMAFVTYYFEEVRHGEYSAKADVITKLYIKGRDCGMWADGWQPDNIKGTFRDYLKEKVRNMNKKKLQDNACKDLVAELAN